MLHLYAARENIDKERFIYEHIEGETFVLVPNQYTLVAEEQALKYMNTDCLFDVEILSMNRLGLRLLTEKGIESVSMLDKYGRFMLLGKLIREHIDDFDIFRKSAGKLTFTTMLNDFISEFKQNKCTLEQVGSMLEEKEADPLLKAKLEELKGVIEAYEAAIEGKYTDSEDYISKYVEAIKDSEIIPGKTIWIYGYDSITPKFSEAMMELAGRADSVNFIVNRSDFDLDEKLVSMLQMMGRERGLNVTCEEIGSEYESPKSETVRRIERGLWNDDLTEAEIEANKEFVPEDLTIINAANPYFEAESAAAYILHLIRDENYRMRDIQVIANDEGVMQPIVKRVFAEYGLDVFMDSARDITDTAAVAFIVNLLWFSLYKGSSGYLFAMLKTGLAGIDETKIEDLENYARAYHIRGNMWDAPFKYGEDALGKYKFAQIEGTRNAVMSKVSGLYEILKKDTVAEFVEAFREYLKKVWKLEDRVTSAADEEEKLGLHDEAQRNVQSYAKALEMLDQIVEIMGDSPLEPAELVDIYTAGLTNVEVGVIPPTVDGLSLGTMIRTRPRPIRAAVIIGANEGILPLSPSPEGLFSIDEKEYFKKKGFALGALDEIKLNEENAAMYRMMSKPSEKLYISWSASDSQGSDARPSELIEALKSLFPMIEKNHLIRKDIISSGWGSDHISGNGVGDTVNTPEESLRHLMGRIKDRMVTEVDPLTKALLKWYRINRAEELETMLKAAEDENAPEPLGRDLSKRLYARSDGSLVLSSSAISSYFDCPFKYFVDRGLRPQEEREFTGDSRSIGDAYHECLMIIARKLISDRSVIDEIMDDDEKLERLVSEELDKIASEYRGGLFVSSGNEVFRMERIKEICAAAAKAMVKQLSSETLTDSVFEEEFGRKKRFSPIHLKIGEDDVYVEGKIDRSDFIDVDGEDRVRIIDYKTGSDTLNLWKMMHGYKMQLMIYMISASTGGIEPAGLFYFNIKDSIEAADGMTMSKLKTLMDMPPEDAYKLKGRYIDEPGVLSSMPEDVLAKGRSEKDRQITREEYETVKQAVLDRIEETAAGILKGTIDIRPLKSGKTLVCSYCSFRTICRQDREYPRTSGRSLPPQPKKETKDK